jgi:hypothetical protein
MKHPPLCFFYWRLCMQCVESGLIDSLRVLKVTATFADHGVAVSTRVPASQPSFGAVSSFLSKMIVSIISSLGLISLGLLSALVLTSPAVSR